MFKHVATYLNTVEEVQPPPLHSQLGGSWWTQVIRDWEANGKDAELPEEFFKKSRDVLECYQLGYACLAAAANTKEADEIETHAQIQELLLKPQSSQRTEEWYKEMKVVLSASEFYSLFGAPRGRGQLVMSKVAASQPDTGPSQRKCCLTMEMTPMDWGIRFEPVAKNFLEIKWQAIIAEMGRLHHPTHKGLAASPDGLIQSAKKKDMIGDLVEIKCPSSRPIGKLIPPNYWYQMQLQLEVTGRHVCQYAEFNFRSLTAQKPTTCEKPQEVCVSGLIYILQNESLCELKYTYGPHGDMEWIPILEEGWEIVERIPWYLEKYWIQPVVRDEAWFQSILPLINQFWEDVEKARKGEFQLPESTVKKKPVMCAIVD
jgi:hypothetical protein